MRHLWVPAVVATPETEYYWIRWSPDGERLYDPDPPNNDEQSRVGDMFLCLVAPTA